jgi:hypothetical protein
MRTPLGSSGMAGSGEIPVATSITILLVAAAVIYVRGIIILTANWPYRAGGNGSAMSVSEVLIYMVTVGVLSVGLWVVLSCISWGARKFSGRRSRPGQWLILMLSAVDLTGFVCLWIVPKIT